MTHPSIQGPEQTMTCAQCGDAVPIPEVIDHLRLLHPDIYDELPKWPDGGLVMQAAWELDEPGPWNEVQ